MDNFKFTMPAEISKSEDGEWKVAGLASTQAVDRQGEVIIQKGIDISEIKQNRGYFNFDHLPGVENLIGTIDGYKHDEKGLYVSGKLFKNHDKAKAVYQIMSSLGESDRGRIGMSVEGKILERDVANPKIIKKCQINKVAITFSPVNTNTYADLVKSMSQDSIDFNAIEDHYKLDSAKIVDPESASFTATQVMAIVQKALGIGAGYTQAPVDLTSGDSLATSDMIDEDKNKKKRKLKTMEKSLYKSNMLTILDQLQRLYPECSRSELWASLQERLDTQFPDINEYYSEK